MATVDIGKGTGDVDIDALRSQLQQGAAKEGVTYDDSDLQGILRNISYDSGGVSLDTATRNALSTYHDRATNVPGDEDGDGVPDGGGGGGGNGGGGGGGGYPRDGGAAATDRQLSDLMAALTAINNDPVNLPEYDLPSVEDLAIEVPGENLSPAIDDTLLDTMGGDDPLNLEQRYRDELDAGPSDPLGLQQILADLLARTKGGGVNSQQLQTRNEMAREQLSKGSATTLADLRAVLADRGLLGDGFEAGETSRLLEPAQAAYLKELRQSQLDESQRADASELNAIDRAQTFTSGQQAAQSDMLSRATGWSQTQIDQRLSAAKTAQERQGMMADIALRQLEDNMSWNKFLAEFGLEREKVAQDIRTGRLAAIQPVLQMFIALTTQSRGGYI